MRIRLNIDPKPFDVRISEVDLSIQFERPEEGPNLKAERLCAIHVVLFAADGYIARRGAPKSRAELSKHHVLEIAAAQIATEALALEELGDPRSFIDLSVNTASSQLIAARRGVGITALPTFTAGLAPELRHVAKDWALKRDLWLAYNPKAAEHFHIRKTIDWVRKAFDTQTYPWFGETMMSPEAVTQHIAAHQMSELFDGCGHYAA